MKVAILQSNYIPWRGYFDIISKADTFVFYDEAQFTKNDWRNRNKINTLKGPLWLSVPVGKKIHRAIDEVSISDSSWQHDHWNKIKSHYSGAPFFEKYKSFFEAFYLEKKWESLSLLNKSLIESMSRDVFKLSTKFLDSRTIQKTCHDPTERLLEILKNVGASEYLSGPAAKSYLKEELFLAAQIKLRYMDYTYSPYPQFHGASEESLSVIDLLFNCGEDSLQYMNGKLV